MKLHLYMYQFEMKPAVVCDKGSFHKVFEPALILTTEKQSAIDKLLKYFPTYSRLRDKKVIKLTLSILCVPELKKLFPKLFLKKEFKNLLGVYNKQYKKFK